VVINTHEFRNCKDLNSLLSGFEYYSIKDKNLLIAIESIIKDFRFVLIQKCLEYEEKLLENQVRELTVHLFTNFKFRAYRFICSHYKTTIYIEQGETKNTFICTISKSGKSVGLANIIVYIYI
jgi:hypothetical protein